MSDECESEAKTPPAPELEARVRAWLAADPDLDTRNELKELLACNDGVAMADRFDQSLTFGTAGLRGAIGAGPNRMNRVVVAHASAGLAAHLLDSADVPPVVVIARDARTKSDIFAEDAARTFAGAGCEVMLIPGAVPTPVLAFAVRYLNADAGVMITASHNPARDNGYKVYLGGADEGAQIVPPTDALIQERIVAASATPFAQIPTGDFEIAGDDLLDAYVRATAAVAPAQPGEFLSVTYTPMHGVGLATFERVCAEAGYPQPSVVDAQAAPDATFPTVPYPNPEEDGALDLAIAHAQREGSDLILANDPDADRLAVCIPEGDSYRTLTGNELGAVLAWWAAERAVAHGELGTFATTYVSAPALERIASSHGFESVRTPSGFKWIGRVPDLIFGYEEALGYLVNPNDLHDKDGISAAVAVLDLATTLHRRGENLGQLIERLATEFGGIASESFSVRFDKPQLVTRAMDLARTTPPAQVAGADVAQVTDYLPDTNLLAWDMTDGSRVLVRPSGTEPKLKIYVFADTVERARDVAASIRTAGPWTSA